jgi:hypothetical protein
MTFKENVRILEFSTTSLARLTVHKRRLYSRSLLIILPSSNNYISYALVIVSTISDHFIIIMALQPFVGPWPPFQFLDPIHSRYNSFDGGSAQRKASTHTENINTE